MSWTNEEAQNQQSFGRSCKKKTCYSRLIRNSLSRNKVFISYVYHLAQCKVCITNWFKSRVYCPLICTKSTYLTYIPVLFRKNLCLLQYSSYIIFSPLDILSYTHYVIVLLEIMLTAHSFTITCFVICFIWPFYVNNTARNNRWNIAWDFKLFFIF